MMDTHKGILYKIARSYTKDKADFEDLYQEMLVQLWQSYPRFEGKSKLSTWMYRVALNTAMTFVKKQRKHKERSQAIGFQQLSDNPFERQAAEQTHQAKLDLLYASIKQLKKEERAIVLLHLEGKQYDEIAAIIGITTSNVGVKLLRAKKKLQAMMVKKIKE